MINEYPKSNSIIIFAIKIPFYTRTFTETTANIMFPKKDQAIIINIINNEIPQISNRIR